MNEHDLLSQVAAAAELFLTTEPIPTKPIRTPEGKSPERRLREALANLREYREHSHEPGHAPVSVRVKLCEQCKAPFFFALDLAHRPSWGKQGWAPFETEPISAEIVHPEHRYVLDFHGWPHPRFHVEQTKTAGQVWVDHRQTCGGRGGPTLNCEGYQRRFRINSERLLIEAESWKETLRTMQRRLKHDDTDADT